MDIVNIVTTSKPRHRRPHAGRRNWVAKLEVDTPAAARGLHSCCQHRSSSHAKRPRATLPDFIKFAHIKTCDGTETKCYTVIYFSSYSVQTSFILSLLDTILLVKTGICQSSRISDNRCSQFNKRTHIV